jgi:hypothetical protein
MGQSMPRDRYSAARDGHEVVLQDGRRSVHSHRYLPIRGGRHQKSSCTPGRKGERRGRFLAAVAGGTTPVFRRSVRCRHAGPSRIASAGRPGQSSAPVAARVAGICDSCHDGGRTWRATVKAFPHPDAHGTTARCRSRCAGADVRDSAWKGFGARGDVVRNGAMSDRSDLIYCLYPPTRRTLDRAAYTIKDRTQPSSDIILQSCAAGGSDGGAEFAARHALGRGPR